MLEEVHMNEKYEKGVLEREKAGNRCPSVQYHTVFFKIKSHYCSFFLLLMLKN